MISQKLLSDTVWKLVLSFVSCIHCIGFPTCLFILAYLFPFLWVIESNEAVLKSLLTWTTLHFFWTAFYLKGKVSGGMYIKFCTLILASADEDYALRILDVHNMIKS